MWTKINQWLLRERYWWKVVNEKPPNSRGVLRRKPTPYDWGLKGQRSRDFEGCFDESWLKITCSYMQSRAVSCIAAEDVECKSYPNLSKNTIKFKRGSVCFSSFASAVGWLSLLLFERLCELNCRSSHWWCSVDSRKSRGWLIEMIFVEQVDNFSAVLDRWSWLPGIFFLWISFP